MDKHTPVKSEYLDDAHALALRAWRTKYPRGFIDFDDPFVEIIRSSFSSLTSQLATVTEDLRIRNMEYETQRDLLGEAQTKLAEERAKVGRLVEDMREIRDEGSRGLQEAKYYTSMESMMETAQRSLDALAATAPTEPPNGGLLGAPLPDVRT